MQLWERQIAPGRAVRDHLKIPQQIPAAISVGQTLLTLCDNLFYTKLFALCVCAFRLFVWFVFSVNILLQV